ncbi:MAG: A/G-specific adenine glycosylase, partial [Planctomycetota bacterium]
VVPYYERFLRLFPTARALASAPLPRVLAAWSGLGYYRRARMLREAARRIVSEHGGRFPRDPDSIRALPGVGPYTTGALLSIAFGRPFPVLDGNVIRVLSRLLALRGDPRKNRGTLEAAAAALVDPRAPGDFNQALMELGALVCTPRRPDCPRCPLRSLCRARALGLEAKIPPARPERTRRVEWASAVLRRNGRVLIVRRPEGGLLAGMWELPTVEAGGASARPSLSRRLRGLIGASARLGREIGRIRHGIEDRAITIRLFDARVSRGSPRTSAARWWVPGSSVVLPLAAAARKSLDLACSLDGPRGPVT